MGRSRVIRRLVVAALAVASMAAVLVAGRPPAHAANPVITFDDLGIQAGGSVTVNSQYSAQGITFNDVLARDYSQSPFPAGFAHSGTVGIEQCFAVEFCTTPITGSFTAGQTSVKVWVGASFAPSEPIDVRLTAFDAGHTSVGSADVTLPASASVVAVQNPLQVMVTDPTIRSFEVTTVPGGFTGGIVVDDVEFSAAGPPPPCNATSVPKIQLTQPPASLTVQNNEFVLEGSVDNGGAPIESATVINDGQSGQKKSDLFPTLVHAGGGAFGPVRFNGLLGPGLNKLIFTATNCLGTGVGPERDIALTPIPSNASFRLLGLEVTQAVQNASNTVPLIAAATNSFKRTFARVYLSVSGIPQIAHVTGTLTASRPDGSHPAGPTVISSLNSVTVGEGATQATFDNARSSLSNSLNFELPQEWLAAGQLHLQLGNLFIEGETSVLNCQFCDNPGDSTLPGQSPGPALVSFHDVPPLRIVLVGVPYLVSQGAVVPPKLVAPSQFDFDMLSSWLRRAYPSAEVQISQMSLTAQQSPPQTCDQVNTLLRQLIASSGLDQRTRFYGLISDNDGKNFVRGCSAIGGQYGSGPAGVSEFAWDTDGTYADWYGGHEIGHMYAREHPGYCNDESRDDTNYPFPGGALGNSLFDDQGFDTGDSSLGLPVSLNDWRAGWTDVMTYCDFEWISGYTYEGILQNLCAADQANCPDHAQFGARALDGSSSPLPRSSKLAVSVTGTLSLATDKVVLDPLMVRPGLNLTPPEPGGAYAVEMRGASGTLLASTPFAPERESDAPSQAAAKALINEVVPFPAGTRQILITHGTKTLASVRVSAHAPTVHVLTPHAGAYKSRVKVRWRSSDADGGRRWFTVLYSADGVHFQPVATGLKRSSVRVDLTALPGGSRARFEVIATDGVLTGTALSPAFRVPVKAPRVSIATPADGASFAAGGSIAFSGTASDLQDGQLAPSQLVWSSSLQGILGTGPGISASLQPGTHVISLTATNHAGKTAVATIKVTVTAVPPVVTAVIVP